MNWREEAHRLQLNGLNHIQIYERLEREVAAPNRAAGLKRVSRELKEPVSRNMPIIENYEPVYHSCTWRGSNHIRFALIGDTHFNSKYVQLTYLHDFYKKCKDLGITKVYHTGDIDDGEQMRIGHQYECYTQGADEHADEIIKNYPQIDGITTYFITGNHDASIYKKCGVDIGKMIAAQRKDLVYLGRDCAIINLTPNCTLELRHPWDGTAYSLSYKTQKMVDSMSDYEKPDILAVGHYHKVEYLYYGDMHVFQTGTFQGPTPFTKGKGLSVAMGGWIVDVEVDEDGKLISLQSKLIPYSKGIQNDYKNFV